MVGFLKQFVELVTAWLTRYRSDPFFRTEVNVIALLAAFAFVVLVLVAASFALLYRDISAAIAEGISEGAASGNSESIAQVITQHIEHVRTQTLLEVVGVIVLAASFFGYIIARVTLAPARGALASQKQFVGNIAHELRTPLSIIKTNTELALLERGINTSLRGTMESNIEELDRISEIINNLLSLSSLVRPERMEFGAVDLGLITDDAVQKLAPLARRGEKELTVRKSPETWVWGNGTALQQIVTNLIKNAIQYTPRGGHVRVTIEPAPNNHVEFIVQDTGIGIARKDLFRIFEPFYRGDPSRNRVYGGSGSGLGLTIVSELVKTHRGKITVRSALGRGTTVSVLFPGIAGHGIIGHEVEARGPLNEIAVDFSARRA